MEEKNTEKKKKKSNFKQIVEGLGGGLLTVGGIIVAVLIRSNSNSNNGNTNKNA